MSFVKHDTQASQLKIGSLYANEGGGAEGGGGGRTLENCEVSNASTSI